MTLRRILLIGSAIAAIWFLINISPLYERVKLDRSYPALSRYKFEPTPNIVLVGSSMAFRIYEGYFQKSVRNLSISGGSPLTGLAIVASYGSLPRTVLVETNIMTRSADNTLIENFGRNDAEPLKWFRPIRALFSIIYYYAKYRPAKPIPESEKTDISEMVAAAATDYGSSRSDESIARHVEDLARIVASIETRGCRIVFFEIPYPQSLGDTHVATKTRSLIRTALPQRQWLSIRTDGLNFVDPFHLDERSAAAVARDIESQIQELASH